MNKPIDFVQAQQRKALDDWYADCKRRVNLRFPRIDFESDHWPIKTLYRTEQRDWHFTELLADFASKDISFREVFRCIIAEMVLAGKPKDLNYSISGPRLLARSAPYYCFDLALGDLRKIEAERLTCARENPASAAKSLRLLTTLSNTVAQLGSSGVIPRLGFHVHAETKAELRKISRAHRDRPVVGKGELLDRRMEAFNDAFNQMDDPILDPVDRVALCALAISLCAPSRINEILCMSINDHVTVNDYGQKTIGELDAIHRAHQMLIVTMKGSKGASWSPKPVLEFMIDVFHHCVDIITDHGKRSRMLVEWYQKNPTTLYLSPELEYLRGRAVSRKSLGKIVYLTENPPILAEKSSGKAYFREVSGNVIKAPNPNLRDKNGKSIQRPIVGVLPWDVVEKLLLAKVHQAMADCRRVSAGNHYEGDLAKMLFLVDVEQLPYLPKAVNYKSLWVRFKQTRNTKGKVKPPVLFEKLNITMPVNGKIQIAEMDSHDPRRWLTTMALTHGEKLSDVLINKWANRCKLSQLKAYDFRTAETIAASAAMPVAAKLTELADISDGLAAVEKLEDACGLKTAILTAHDAGIAMTTMDAISQAVEDRPVAKSSRGIIVIYPQRFGVCLHQHHEKPCRNYSNDLVAACATCNSAAYVKGHLPTNEETRKSAKQTFTSVVRHLENLAHTHNRSIADDPAALGEHMLTLIEKGLSPATLEWFAAHLVEECHQINLLIKDQLLARRLEQAFVLRGVVKRLDDPDVTNGALIKYHNPKQHADLPSELALDTYGGREQIACDEKKLIAEYPQFAPKSHAVKDERHLISPVDDESED